MNADVAVRSLAPVIWHDAKVITTELLAKLYGTDAHNVIKNYRNNDGRFVEGKHFYKISGKDLNNLRVTSGDLQISSKTRSLLVWTERGAARHAKMLETDAAWDAFEALGDYYFKGAAEDSGGDDSVLSTARDLHAKLPNRSSFCDLPFVYRPKRGFKGASNWHVSPATDYVAACAKGREYAAYFIQYLKNNPGLVGASVLGWIASDIDFMDKSDAKGHWVGFFSHLERLIYASAQQLDTFSDMTGVNDMYAKINTDCALADQK